MGKGLPWGVVALSFYTHIGMYYNIAFDTMILW